MRLYLSSYQFGDDAHHFASMVGGRRRGLLIMNALDASADTDRRAAAARNQCATLAELGLSAEDLDLRSVRAGEAARILEGADFVWVHGGNVFVLRAALAESGMDAALVEALDADSLVYGGFSAGACVLGPSLAGYERCDPPADVAAVAGTVRWDGLGVLDRAVVPHLDSPEHPDSATLEELAAVWRENGTPFIGLRDGEALVIDGGTASGG